MIKVYIGEVFNYAHLPILYPNLGAQERNKNLFLNKVWNGITRPVFELVEKPESADFFLFPHDYFLTSEQPKQALRLASLSERYKKKIIIFGHGDSDCDVPISNAIIFRTSQYRYKIKSNEIIMPAYVEDFGRGTDTKIRLKGEKPIIGFCGWADFINFRQKAFFYLKQTILDLKNFLSGHPVIIQRRGLWFRKKALKILGSSLLVETNFIIRRSFSGHKATLKDAPERIRKEYIDNSVNSDFILTVKGYGNFSLRFYEALSLGRIPLFLNTDCVLPLENIINYNDFVLFADYKNISQIDKILANFFNNLTEDKFIEMQKNAREAFERYLKIDSFFALIPGMLKKMV